MDPINKHQSTLIKVDLFIAINWFFFFFLGIEHPLTNGPFQIQETSPSHYAAALLNYAM